MKIYNLALLYCDSLTSGGGGGVGMVLVPVGLKFNATTVTVHC